MLERYDAIYLAPHLDDAALSCGGQIFQETAVGKTILILTIMAGDPPQEAHFRYAQLLHERWKLAGDVVAQRRQEDEKACHILGADCLHWDIPDCIYRANPDTGEALYEDWPQITDKIHPVDHVLVASLARRFASLPSAKHVYAPLTVGHHVDHQIVRQAAELCWGNGLLYYEDYPYVQIPGTLAEVIPEKARNWQATAVSLSEHDLQTKADAIEAYASQISSFFTDRQDLEAQIGDYARAVGGERIWKKR